MHTDTTAVPDAWSRAQDRAANAVAQAAVRIAWGRVEAA